MDFHKFIATYRFPLLNYFLKDSDFELKLYLENNLFTIKNIGESKEKKKELRTELKTIDKHFLRNHFKKTNTLYELDEYLLSESDFEIINEECSDFTNISRLSNILWSDTLIEKYQHKWNWNNLSANHSIDWSQNRINKFEHLIKFNYLSYNSNAILNDRVLYKYQKSLDWNAISGNGKIGKWLPYDWFKKNKNVVWKNLPSIGKYYKNFEFTNEVFDFNSFKMFCSKSNLKPSLSSNTYINWTLEEFETQLSQIDFWVLAYFGNLDFDIINSYGNNLNENRLHYTAFEKTSDWHDEHPVYRNGWENLLENEKFIINEDMLKLLNKYEATKIIFKGDAREGFVPEEKTQKVIDFEFNPIKLELEFESFIKNVDYIPVRFIHSTYINETIWQNIIKPYFVKYPSFIKHVLGTL
jgi:hypothetical protein